MQNQPVMARQSQEETDRIGYEFDKKSCQRIHQKFVEDRRNRVTFEDHAKYTLKPAKVKKLQENGVPEATFREILASFYNYVEDIVAKEDLFNTLFPNMLQLPNNFTRTHGIQDSNDIYKWVMFRVLSKVKQWRTTMVEDWELNFGSQYDPEVLEKVRHQLWLFTPWTYPERQQEWTRLLVDHIERLQNA
eukprot:TRINITY_DN415_c0_g1_i1.p1 TRINITY_DN415_c0_g1~~TRINITY_DN415_c0_g1_i1.p1  ORF type:complete len:190 (-),score=20.10 TRINITY_DN415_c0_g1_i1:62-631(-)